MILLRLVSTTDGIFTLFYVRYYNIITVIFLHQQKSDILVAQTWNTHSDS